MSDDYERVVPRPDIPGVDLDGTLAYLDELRGSGTTNMFGAAPHLARKFGLTRQESNDVLGYWMRTYGDRHPDAARRTL